MIKSLECFYEAWIWTILFFTNEARNAKIVLLWVLEKGCLSTRERKRKAKSKLKDAKKIMRHFQKSFFC